MLYNNSGFLYNYGMKIEKGNTMRGSIRTFGGLFIVMGAVGTLDFDPKASVLGMMLLAAVGLLLCWSGTRAMGGK